GARILLAEDNRLNQIVAEGFLHQLGLEVTVVGDGAQAVSAMQASPPGTFAAILMDLHMPVLDGLESTRRIRALSAGAHTPIIGMTAAVLPEDRAQCLEAGMVDHVSKPVVPERLIQILLRWTQPERASTPPRVNPAPAAPPAASSHDVIDHPLELDLDALRERLHGNEDLLWILLKTFLDSESDTSHVLEGMLSQGEVQRAKFKVHDLKGSSANLGAMRISDASAALETALMKGQGIDSAMAHLRQTLTTGLGTIRFLMSNRSSRGA
ncbi:MAG: response regulator, partial [Pseudomonadota bacterium]